MTSQLLPRRGIDVLADILLYCEPETNDRILSGLKKTHPQVVAELRKKIITFSDLSRADPAGVQRLLRQVSLRDLAVSLKGAPEEVLKNLAHNMSTRAIEDLRQEITALRPTPSSEVEAARRRILGVARELRERKELYFKQPGGEGWIE